MGYYSTVTIILPEKAYHRLQDKISVIHDYDTKMEVYQLLSNAKILQHEDTRDVLIYWSDIKWYDDDQDYKDIAFVNDFLRTLSEQDYAFLRIGEDIDDNEVFGDYYSDHFEAYLEHNIHLNTDNTKEITIDGGTL